MAATSATTASAHTISRSVKPSSQARRSARPAGDDRGRAIAASLAGGPIGEDVVRAMLSRGTVGIGTAPGIIGHGPALEIRPAPGGEPGRALHERAEPLCGRGVASGVEIEKVERAREALDLDARRLDLRFAE